MKQQSKYFWPASAITPADMAILHAARESSKQRVPISALIARAIRQQYGQTLPETARQTETQPERKAAA